MSMFNYHQIMIVKSVLKNLSGKMLYNISRNMCEKKKPIAEKVAAMSPTELVKNTVKVSDWNKRILVFAGRYKTMSEIPDILPHEVVDKARNRTRVKVCNIMIVLTILGSIYMAMSGKQAVERGETVSKMNLDWHREYNERARKEAEEAVRRA